MLFIIPFVYIFLKERKLNNIISKINIGKDAPLLIHTSHKLNVGNNEFHYIFISVRNLL